MDVLPTITNETILNYSWLRDMYSDTYFPTFLVDKIKDILLNLCFEIEQQKPQNLESLYVLTHAATEKINALEEEFFEQGSELETAARDCMGGDFEAVAMAYGFEDADIEMLIAPREW